MRTRRINEQEKSKNMPERIANTIANLKGIPDAQAIVMLISETGIRFQEAVLLTADEFYRMKYHSPKEGKEDLDLPNISAETRAAISSLISGEGRIFKREIEDYRRLIGRYADGISILELVKYNR